MPRLPVHKSSVSYSTEASAPLKSGNESAYEQAGLRALAKGVEDVGQTWQKFNDYADTLDNHKKLKEFDNDIYNRASSDTDINNYPKYQKEIEQYRSQLDRGFRNNDVGRQFSLASQNNLDALDAKVSGIFRQKKIEKQQQDFAITKQTTIESYINSPASHEQLNDQWDNWVAVVKAGKDSLAIDSDTFVKEMSSRGSWEETRAKNVAVSDPEFVINNIDNFKFDNNIKKDEVLDFAKAQVKKKLTEAELNISRNNLKLQTDIGKLYEKGELTPFVLSSFENTMKPEQYKDWQRVLSQDRSVVQTSSVKYNDLLRETFSALNISGRDKNKSINEQVANASFNKNNIEKLYDVKRKALSLMANGSMTIDDYNNLNDVMDLATVKDAKFVRDGFAVYENAFNKIEEWAKKTYTERAMSKIKSPNGWEAQGTDSVRSQAIIDTFNGVLKSLKRKDVDYLSKPNVSKEIDSQINQRLAEFDKEIASRKYNIISSEDGKSDMLEVNGQMYNISTYKNGNPVLDLNVIPVVKIPSNPKKEQK